MIIDYPWYFVLLCLLAGAAYAAGLYYVGHRHFSKGVNALLAALRFVAVTVIALLLLAPVAKRTVHERQKPLIVLVDDCSESVQMSADSAFSLAALGDELEDHCRVLYSADTTNTGQTDISAMLEVSPDAAAIVLASDGIYNRGQNPTTTAERLGIPVYTVALGDTTPRRDAALSNIRHNRIAYLGNAFPVEITIGAHRLKGRTAQLTVTDGRGKKVASQQVGYSDDDFGTTLTFSIQAEEKGLQKYTVSLSVVENEVERENNVLTFYTDVIDGRRKVAIVGNAPHPDLAALKQAVESNPNYEAEVFLNEELRVKHPEGELSTLKKKDILAKNEELKAYSLAILHNLPSSTRQIPKAFENLPQVFVIGCQTDLLRFNALHTGVEIVSKVKKSSEVTAVYNDHFTLFNLDASDGEALEQLPPLDAPFGEGKVSSSLQSLFTARLGNIDTRQPLVAALARGRLHVAFVWGEGLWKWRLADYLNNNSHEHFDRLVSQIVNFTAITDQRERFIVETERHYSDNDNIVIHAQLYNDTYEPFNTPDAIFMLMGDSIKGDFNFTREGDGYTLSLGRLPEGLYRYTAQTKYNGETLTTEGSFAVEALHLEQANLTADHTLLRTISTITGGQMFYPDQQESLRDSLATIKPVIYTHTRFSELLNLPWVLLLIVVLLGIEWVLRKYYGEV